MPFICYVDTPKGGTGKTTTSICLASALARHGRVLLASISKQNEVMALIEGQQPKAGLRDAVIGKSPPRPRTGGAFDVIAAGNRAVPDDIHKAEAAIQLRAALNQGHDWVIVDGAQMSDACCFSMLRACDMLIVPVTFDRFAARAATGIIRYTVRFPPTSRPFLRILFTQVWAKSKRSASQQRLYEQMREEWAQLAFKTEIRHSRDKHSTDWDKHTSEQMDATLIRPRGILAADHDKLASELLGYASRREPTTGA